MYLNDVLDFGMIFISVVSVLVVFCLGNFEFELLAMLLIDNC